MGTIRLLIAAALLAGLGGVVWWVLRHPDAGSPKSTTAESTTLLNVPDSSIQSIDIQKKDSAKLTLERQNSKWTITAPEAYPADQEAVSGIASSVSPATADSVVEQKPADVKKYGLAAPSLTVTLHEKGGKTDQIVLGDEVPAASLIYARVNADPKVYAVGSSLKTSFDKSLNDLRDKRLLTFDQNLLTRIQLLSGKPAIEFGKNGQSDWAIVQPQPYRADNFQVEELLRKLGEAKMDLAGASENLKKADSVYAAGKPVGTAKLTDAAGTQSLEVRKNGDDYYGKSSVVSGVFKLNSDLGKELEKQLDDFRNKKLFDFGFTDPTKVEIQGKTYTRSGADWKVGGQTMDAGGVQGFIDKLRELSASKFAAGGFTTSTATIAVVSNDGKRTERVEFSKTPNGYIARRGGETGLYEIDAKAVNDILEASNTIKPAASKK